MKNIAIVMDKVEEAAVLVRAERPYRSASMVYADLMVYYREVLAMKGPGSNIQALMDYCEIRVLQEEKKEEDRNRRLCKEREKILSKYS